MTGDMKYHDAREAESLGIAMIDAGHFATEVPMVDAVAAKLRQELQARKCASGSNCVQGETEPFQILISIQVKIKGSGGGGFAEKFEAAWASCRRST